MTIPTSNIRLATALAAVFVAASSVAAAAADLAVRSPSFVKAPVLEPVVNWSGFYVGGQAGAASMTTSFKDPDGAFFGQGLNPDRSIKFTGGGYGGFNWQSGSVVVGIDAQWSWYGNEVRSNPFGELNSSFINTKLDSAGSVKARVGLAFTDTLVYVAAGPAWADMKLSTSRLTEDDFNGSGTNRKAVGGLAVAVGVEHMITPNWILRGQIQYAEYEAQKFQVAPFFRLGQQSSVLESTIGLSYKFGPHF
jgi:outer membrane immunogenic protein